MSLLYVNQQGMQVKEIICDTSTGSYAGSYGEEKYGLLNAKNAVEAVINKKYSGAEDTETNKKTEAVENLKDADQTIQRQSSDEIDICLVLDTSGSMSGTPIEETKEAAVNFVETVFEGIPVTQSSVITTTAKNENATYLSVDSNGDGKRDFLYRAAANSSGKEVPYKLYMLSIGGIIALIGISIILLVRRRQLSRRSIKASPYCSGCGAPNTGARRCPHCGRKRNFR